jgi:hypothetical protein
VKKSTKITLAGLVLALIALVAGVVFSSGTVEASRGPNKSGTSTVTFNAEDLQLVTLSDAVRMWDYPDGAHMGQVTFHWEDTGGSTWDVNSYSIWNVPYSSGGHTDTLVNSCKFNYVSDNMCTGGAGDGGTRVDWGQDNLSDAQTFWLRIRFKYGDTEYCRQVYVNHNGATSVSYCTN